MLTYAEASELFDYDPETGIILWRKSVLGGTIAGEPAGSRTRRYNWIKYRGRYYSGHKIAWLLTYGAWPDHQIDHINGDTFDNRISNLRRTSIAENCQNRRTRKDNASGVKGVQLRPTGLWRARIWIKGKSVNLGHFASKEEAHAAYQKAAQEHFGEFARFG